VSASSPVNRVRAASSGPNLISNVIEAGCATIDGTVDALFIPAVTVELKLYSREWCSWCIDAKEFLAERGYNFTVIDVGQDREAYEEMKELSDQTYVPTFVAGDKVLANFDTDQLEQFLREHEIAP
jgi:glutaredoxin 3